MIPPRRPGPGLAKTRGTPTLRTRTVQLVIGSDARWREILEAAEVVSEGATKVEGTSRVYYGSTTLVLRHEHLDGEPATAGRAALVSLVQRDPHLRVRLLRIAQREAAARAGAPLGALSAEISARDEPDGIWLHVDVMAIALEVAPRSGSL